MDILLVDDHGLFREGVSALLQAADPDLHVAHAVDAASAMAHLETHGAELVFLDLGLPDADGLAVLSRIKETHPDVRVVVLSGTEDRDTVLECIQRGAMGFIPKSTDNPDTLWHALRMASSGAVTVPASIHSRPPRVPDSESAAQPGKASTGNTPALTARQQSVLDLLLQGLPNKSIARRLDIAESTARDYVSELLGLYGVTNRTQLVLEVTRRNLPPR